jgi:hypothetical protein
VSKHAAKRISMNAPGIHSSADPDGASAQIDVIGVPWLMVGEEPSAAPNAGMRGH